MPYRKTYVNAGTRGRKRTTSLTLKRLLFIDRRTTKEGIKDEDE